MGFYIFFLFFLIPTVYQTLHCQSKLKTWYVSTKIVPLGDVLRTLCPAGYNQDVYNDLKEVLEWIKRYAKMSLSTLNHIVSWFLPNK